MPAGKTGRILKCFAAFFRVLPLLLMAPGAVMAQSTSQEKLLTMDLDFYPYLEDVKNDAAMTVVTNARLPYGFSYFSFINFGGIFNSTKTRFLLTEQNLRWKITDRLPVDMTLQLNARSGSDNDVWRLGFRWRFDDTPYLGDFFRKIHLVYNITFHYKNFDDRGDDNWQMEHVFKLTFPYISERLYVGGFVDHTFDQDVPAGFPSQPVIGEVQLGLRLFDNLYAITEYRVNQNRRSDVNNFAIGLEYKAGW